ncbi:hypothetical protein CPB84DRAFT_1785047, partial [Gymnopilus junonius]
MDRLTEYPLRFPMVKTRLISSFMMAPKGRKNEPAFCGLVALGFFPSQTRKTVPHNRPRRVCGLQKKHESGNYLIDLLMDWIPGTNPPGFIKLRNKVAEQNLTWHLPSLFPASSLIRPQSPRETSSVYPPLSPFTMPADRPPKGRSTPCLICNKTMARQSDLPRHMKSHEKADSDMNFCTYARCVYKTLQHSNLVIHLRRHRGEKPFGFAEDGAMKRHRMRKHGYIPDREKKRQALEKLIPEAVRESSLQPTSTSKSQDSTKRRRRPATTASSLNVDTDPGANLLVPCCPELSPSNAPVELNSPEVESSLRPSSQSASSHHSSPSSVHLPYDTPSFHEYRETRYRTRPRNASPYDSLHRYSANTSRRGSELDSSRWDSYSTRHSSPSYSFRRDSPSYSSPPVASSSRCDSPLYSSLPAASSSRHNSPSYASLPVASSSRGDTPLYSPLPVASSSRSNSPPYPWRPYSHDYTWYSSDRYSLSPSYTSRSSNSPPLTPCYYGSSSHSSRTSESPELSEDEDITTLVASLISGQKRTEEDDDT